MEFSQEKIIETLTPSLINTFKTLKNVMSVDFLLNTPASIFAVIFREVFLNTDSDYQLSDGTFGASRANWTYTIAYSFLTTAKIMGYDCIFETEGKRDAVVRRKDLSETILFSEWEWDYKDVFGKGKEIDKLIKSVKKDKAANGFLFTYVPQQEYVDYLKKVADYWQKKNNKYEDPPLIFMTALFDHAKGMRNITILRTCTIYNDNIVFWEDKEFT